MGSAKKNYYPALIILLLAGFLSFLGWSAMRAADSDPQVTDADYYSKGLKYSSTLLEKQAAQALGWKISSRLERRTLRFHLNDSRKQPVKGAHGTLSLFLPDTSERVTLPLHEDNDGSYLVKLPDSLLGEVGARVEFEHRGARIGRQLLLNL